MGRYSGNGMGPAFRVYWPRSRSGKAMQADLDRRYGRDPETIAALRELQHVAGLSRHMGDLVQKFQETEMHPLRILAALANEIRHAERCAAALKASKG